jgi:putative nucleotidyltransferase with HDIG domain
VSTLKKIDSMQVTEGMFIQELCSSWLNNPFWKKSFLVDDHTIIDKLLQSGVLEVWIDTAKGLDVEIEDDADETAIAVLHSAEAVPPKVAVSHSAVSMDDELSRAADIVDRSRTAVLSMFTEARMGKAVDADSALPLVEEIASSVLRNPGALIGLARLKTTDDYTYMHSVAVCALMISLAMQLALDEAQVRDAGLAGLLHDIGKMSVPMAILNKPDKLTDTEFSTIKQHPEAGYQILRRSDQANAMALDVCRHHHEKIDGTGYPQGLSGDQISLYARMGAICDVYDAVTSNRPYKRGWCPSESIHKMAGWCGSHFDERIFQAFVRSIGIYPVGTLVRLTSGRLGVVVEQQIGKSLLSPKIRVFYLIASRSTINPELIDLADPKVQDKIAAHENASTYGLTNIDQYWVGEAVAHG